MYYLVVLVDSAGAYRLLVASTSESTPDEVVKEYESVSHFEYDPEFDWQFSSNIVNQFLCSDVVKRADDELPNHNAYDDEMIYRKVMGMLAPDRGGNEWRVRVIQKSKDIDKVMKLPDNLSIRGVIDLDEVAIEADGGCGIPVNNWANVTISGSWEDIVEYLKEEGERGEDSPEYLITTSVEVNEHAPPVCGDILRRDLPGGVITVDSLGSDCKVRKEEYVLRMHEDYNHNVYIPGYTRFAYVHRSVPVAVRYDLVRPADPFSSGFEARLLELLEEYEITSKSLDSAVNITTIYSGVKGIKGQSVELPEHLEKAVRGYESVSKEISEVVSEPTLEGKIRAALITDDSSYLYATLSKYISSVFRNRIIASDKDEIPEYYHAEIVDKAALSNTELRKIRTAITSMRREDVIENPKLLIDSLHDSVAGYIKDIPRDAKGLTIPTISVEHCGPKLEWWISGYILPA